MIDYVNIKQGSKSCPRFSGGNTIPLTQLPFAMAGFVPQTAGDNGNWFYHPDDRITDGIRLTHQPSPWIGDYGALVLCPQSGTPHYSTMERSSGFRPQEAVLSPHYMNIRFLRPRCDFELVPTERGAYIRLNFEDDKAPFLSVLPVSSGFVAELDAENNRVMGYNSASHNPSSMKGFKEYFVLQLEGGICNAEGSVKFEEGIHIALNSKNITARLAISYISPEQALENLKQDTVLGGFEKAKQNAESLWEEKLGLIEVKTENESLLRTFYSCLYRVFLYPHKAYEIDKNGNAVHYCPFDGSVRQGIRYTDNGFWDTYRTVYPLFSIIAPDTYAELLKGFVQDYLDSGWLPRWTSMGAVNCMPSTLIDAVIADAAVKGIGSNELIKTAFEGMLKHSAVKSDNPALGRNGVDDYNSLGYVPYGEERETVNLTLDAAYGDFCTATVASVLNKADIAEKYLAKSRNYKNLFDRETGFMRAKDKQGNFRPDFSPISWGGDYTEGAAWQNSFAVPHDIEGLAELYGGKDKLIAKLDELFATPPYYEIGAYPFEIHEITEMAALDFGQCGINNQPSFHIPFIYAALGRPEKAAYHAHRMCLEAFSSDDDGFPGDEDNGTTSAWFIFASMGLYPLCPGKAEYVNIGKSLFNSIKINGKCFDPKDFGEVISHAELI